MEINALHGGGSAGVGVEAVEGVGDGKGGLELGGHGVGGGSPHVYRDGGESLDGDGAGDVIAGVGGAEVVFKQDLIDGY